MRTKLLKKLRSNAYLERRNSEYRAVLKAGMFIEGITSCWMGTKQEAEEQLRYAILFIARMKYKRGKIKMW